MPRCRDPTSGSDKWPLNQRLPSLDYSRVAAREPLVGYGPVARIPTKTTTKEAPMSPADSATSPVAFATSPLPLSATFGLSSAFGDEGSLGALTSPL